MSFAAAFPADASPDAGPYEHPTTDPQPPVGTLPTGEHAEAEAAALQAARTDTEPALRRGGLVVFGSILTADQQRPTPDPDPAVREPVEPSSYSNTTTGRVLASIDDAIGGTLQQRNQILRGQIRDVTAQLAGERAQRQRADASLGAVRGERDAAFARVAELELTVGALGSKLDGADKALRITGAAIRHAIGHDESAATEQEGGEADG